MSFLTKNSAGDLNVISYHPNNSPTWHWSVVLSRRGGRGGRSVQRTGQWHDFYRLPFGWCLIISQQDYHKASRT